MGSLRINDAMNCPKLLGVLANTGLSVSSEMSSDRDSVVFAVDVPDADAFAFDVDPEVDIAVSPR